LTWRKKRKSLPGGSKQGFGHGYVKTTVIWESQTPERNHPMLQGKEGVSYEGLGFVLLLSEIHAANSFFTQCCAQQLGSCNWNQEITTMNDEGKRSANPK
jgi:hypothetical protein